MERNGRQNRAHLTPEELDAAISHHEYVHERKLQELFDNWAILKKLRERRDSHQKNHRNHKPG